MRILFRATYPPPFGGIATALTGAANALVDRGHEVIFMSDAFEDRVETPRQGITVIRYSSRAHWKSLANPLRFARALPGILRLIHLGASPREAVGAAVAAQKMADVVRTHGVTVASTYMVRPGMYLVTERPKVPTMLMVFGDVYDDPSLAARPQLVRGVLESADSLSSPSRYCGGSIREVGLDPTEVEVITLGVNVERFTPDVDTAAIRAGLGIGAHQKVVLFLGRFDDEMGATTAMECVPPVLSAREDCVFVLAGAKGRRSEEAVAMSRNWAGRMIVRENVPPADLPGYMAMADVLLAPTKPGHPCCGMAIKEALACGTVVVATRTGGHPEVIDDGITGHLVPVASDRPSVAIMSQRVIELLADDANRKRMGAAGRAQALARYDSRTTGAVMERLFTELLDKKRKA